MTADDLMLAQWRDAVISGGLPDPLRSDRWQPLRAGLVNMWEYEVAEVWFADGRLQLMGANESGKSTLMILTTLILLAGDTARHLVDTLGDSSRSFRFYVEPRDHPLDRRERDAERHRAWAWTEYGRLGVTGPEFFTTLVFAETRRADSRLVPRWCTIHGNSRVRAGATLLTSRVVADPDDLKHCPGFVAHRSGELYREEVARRLFGTDGSWLDQLIRILRWVRTPQLGAKLDLAFLTNALRNALPPLHPDEVNQLAEGWEQLERMRRERDTAEEALAEIRVFTNRRWMTWSDAVVRSAADPLVSTDGAFGRIAAEQRSADRKRAMLRQQLQGIDGQIGDVELQSERADAAAKELRASSDYAEASELLSRAKWLEEDAARAATQAKDSTARAGQAEVRLREAATHHKTTLGSVTEAGEAVEHAAGQMMAAAAQAGVGDTAERWWKARDLGRIEAAAGRRDEAARLAWTLQSREETARNAADTAAEAAGKADALASAAAARVEAAEDAIETAVHGVAESIRSWASDLGNLAPPPALSEQWVSQVAEMSEADRPRPQLISLVLQTHMTPMRRERDARAADLRHLITVERQAKSAAEDQLRQVEAETDPVPAPPSLWTRRSRPTGMSAAGAPLWRLLDPIEGVPSEVVDRLESALDASGLLQAWVTVDGAYVVDRDGEDTVLVARHGPLSEEQSLLAVLTPARDAGPELTPAVTRLLQECAYSPTNHNGAHVGERPTFDAEGRWRHGVLSGRVGPAPGGARLMGAGVRAADRARRAQALRVAISGHEAEERILVAQLEQVAAELDRLERAAKAVPDDDRVVASVLEVLQARRDEERTRADAEQARQEAEQRGAAADEAASESARHAHEHALPRDIDSIQGVIEAVVRLRRALNVLDSRLQAALASEQSEESARRELERWKEAHREAESVAAKDRSDADFAAEKAEVARRAVGKDRQALLDEVMELEAHVQDCARKLEELRRGREPVNKELVRTELTLEQVAEQLREAEERREVALAAWLACVDQSLPVWRGVARPADRTLQAALETARGAQARIRPQDWPTDPQLAYRRVQVAWQQVITDVVELRSRLERQGDRTIQVEDPAGEPGGSPGAVRVVIDGTGMGLQPPEAVRVLDEQLARLRSGYDEELERTINQLLGSTFVEHLRDRLVESERLRSVINQKLRSSPTATTGLILNLSRVPVAEERDANQVLDALERDYHLLPEEAQEQIRAFLAARIRSAHDTAQAEGDANWRARLAAGLDYRSWFDLRLRYRVPGGHDWRNLDREDHEVFSGGPKVITLLQPFLAALEALYGQAPGGPRMVWLDEAFGGLDLANRAMMLGLLYACDLDWMIAGPGMIATAATVPKAALWLVRRAPKPFAGVDLELMLWAGGRLDRLETPDPADLPDLAAPSATDPMDGLRGG